MFFSESKESNILAKSISSLFACALPTSVPDCMAMIRTGIRDVHVGVMSMVCIVYPFVGSMPTASASLHCRYRLARQSFYLGD